MSGIKIFSGNKKKSRQGKESIVLFGTIFVLCLVLMALQMAGALASVEWRLQDAHYQKCGLVSPEIFFIGIYE